MIEKKCTICKTVRSISEFNKKKTAIDGLQNKCRTCSKSYAKSHYKADKSYYIAKANNRRLLLLVEVNDYKKAMGCHNCPENDPCCLDLHHLGNKKFTIASAINRKSVGEVWTEIAKCVVLCANCHRKVHAGKVTLLSKEIK